MQTRSRACHARAAAREFASVPEGGDRTQANSDSPAAGELTRRADREHRMHAREFAWSLDLGTGSRISDPAMKLVGIPAVSRTCTSHCHCTNLQLCVVLVIV